MIIKSPGDVAFTILNFSVFWYGIILAFAVLAGVVCAEFLSKKFSDIPKDFFIDNSPVVIILGIIGARLYYCLVNYSYYINHPVEIFDIRQGGLSVHGMIIFGVITVYFLAKKYKLNLLKLLDILSCSAILAQAIGRWGNFFNSEAFGYPTNADWGVFIPVSKRPVEFLAYDYFHPTFLYESLLDLFIFFILLFILRRQAKKQGYVFFSYLVLYSAARILVESVRIDSVLNVLGVPIAVWVSIIAIFIGFSGILLLNRLAGS